MKSMFSSKTQSRAQVMLNEYIKSGVDVTQFPERMRETVLKAVRGMSDEQFLEFLKTREVDGKVLHDSPRKVMQYASLCANGWKMTPASRQFMSQFADSSISIPKYLQAAQTGISFENLEKIANKYNTINFYQEVDDAFFKIAKYKPDALDGALNLYYVDTRGYFDEAFICGAGTVISIGNIVEATAKGQIDSQSANYLLQHVPHGEIQIGEFISYLRQYSKDARPLTEYDTNIRQIRVAQQLLKALADPDIVEKYSDGMSFDNYTEKLRAFAESSHYCAPIAPALKYVRTMDKEQLALLGACLARAERPTDFARSFAKAILALNAEQVKSFHDIIDKNTAYPHGILHALIGQKAGITPEQTVALLSIKNADCAFTFRDAFEHGWDDTRYVRALPERAANVIAAIARTPGCAHLSAEAQRDILSTLEQHTHTGKLTDETSKMICNALRKHPDITPEATVKIIDIAFSGYDHNYAKQLINDVASTANYGQDEANIGDDDGIDEDDI